MQVVIHHNPDCGTSRNVLKIVKDAGYSPTVIAYIDIGCTRPQLLTLFAAADLTPKSALRRTKSPAETLGLLEDHVSDETIFEAMLDNPVLVNRPIVCTAKGVKLCRPSEAVLDVLDQWPAGPYAKEDGEMIINAEGTRVV
ncbi:MAG: arsenate reductase family protein [Pseudomonadota bacterium]